MRVWLPELAQFVGTQCFIVEISLSLSARRPGGDERFFAFLL
jgi:hypothetical protein